MASSYSRVLARPGARAFSAAGLIARFPMSMVGISTILAVEAVYAEYFAAGLVSAANIVAMAIGAPMLARLVDAHGQARVMLPALIASSAALAGLIAATSMRLPLALITVLSALAGALSGSMGSLVRARWTAMLRTPEDIHTAFSLEAALDEVAFIIGPVLATALSTSSLLPVTSGWAVALAMQLVGGLWFLSQRGTEPAVHARTPGQGAGRGRNGRGSAAAPPRVLSHGAVLAIVLIFLCSGAMFGANDIAVAARTKELGMRSAAGAVLAAWSAGSLTAALIYGSRSWGWPLWKQLLAGLAVFAAGTSTFLAAPNLVVLSVLMLVTGMAIAPTITTGNNIIQVTVAPSQLTEGLAWVGTALNIGVSLGSLLGGILIDLAGSTGGFLVVASSSWVALLVGLGMLRALRRVRTTGGLSPH